MATTNVRSDKADGYRDGWEGYGWYRNGRRVDSGDEARARRHAPRRLAVGVAIAALLFAIYLIVMHWHAIVTGVFTLVGLVIMGVCLWFGGLSSSNADSSKHDDDSLGHPYSTGFSANVDHDVATKLDWPRSYTVMSDDDD